MPQGEQTVVYDSLPSGWLLTEAMRKIDWLIDLTPRAKAILAGIVAGLTDGQIAESLDLNVDTVKMHINVIYSMIGVKNRMQAALWAVENLDLQECGDPPTEIDTDLDN